MNKHCVEAATQEIQTETCKNLASQCQKDFTVAGQSIDPRITIVQGNNVNHKFFKANILTPMEILNKVLTLVLPQRLMNNLMSEQLIDINIANKWIVEYKKFLVMAYLSDSMISPSEQVDQVWHLHMTYTQHYRATCQTLLEKDFKHAPSPGGSSEGKRFEGIYQDTLDFYQEVFLVSAPEDVWESQKQRFKNKNFEYRNINLYRLAVLYSMKVANPNFLQRSAPPVPKAPPAGQNLKALPPQQKKMILRRNKRNKYKNQNQKYGWRNQYHGDTYYVYQDYSYSSRGSHRGDHNDHGRCRNDDYDYYGPDYMVGGGLIIIGNP